MSQIHLQASSQEGDTFEKLHTSPAAHELLMAQNHKADSCLLPSKKVPLPSRSDQRNVHADVILNGNAVIPVTG